MCPRFQFRSGNCPPTFPIFNNFFLVQLLGSEYFSSSPPRSRAKPSESRPHPPWPLSRNQGRKTSASRPHRQRSYSTWGPPHPARTSISRQHQVSPEKGTDYALCGWLVPPSDTAIPFQATTKTARSVYGAEPAYDTFTVYSRIPQVFFPHSQQLQIGETLACFPARPGSPQPCLPYRLLLKAFVWAFGPSPISPFHATPSTPVSARPFHRQGSLSVAASIAAEPPHSPQSSFCHQCRARPFSVAPVCFSPRLSVFCRHG